MSIHGIIRVNDRLLLFFMLFVMLLLLGLNRDGNGTFGRNKRISKRMVVLNGGCRGWRFKVDVVTLIGRKLGGVIGECCISQWNTVKMRTAALGMR